MKTRLGTIGSATCLAAVLVLTASTAPAQNLLVDPSFESGAFAQPNPIPVPGGVGGGWGAFGASITTAAAHTGTHSAQINDNGWNPQGFYQLLAASAGQTYNLDAWYMSPNPSVSAYATPALVQISYFDATGTGIPGGAFGNWQPLGAANTWVDSPTVTALAPAGTAYVGAYVMMMDNNGANGLQFYVDDANLTLVPEPSSLALLGLGLVSALIWRRRQ
jgi:PEP-CTERM motif